MFDDIFSFIIGGKLVFILIALLTPVFIGGGGYIWYLSNKVDSLRLELAKEKVLHQQYKAESEAKSEIFKKTFQFAKEECESLKEYLHNMPLPPGIDRTYLPDGMQPIEK